MTITLKPVFSGDEVEVETNQKVFGSALSKGHCDHIHGPYYEWSFYADLAFREECAKTGQLPGFLTEMWVLPFAVHVADDSGHGRETACGDCIANAVSILQAKGVSA